MHNFNINFAFTFTIEDTRSAHGQRHLKHSITGKKLRNKSTFTSFSDRVNSNIGNNICDHTHGK